MFIALVDFHVAPADRDRALAALLAEVPSVTALAGCRTFRPHADPASDSRIGVIHEWESRDAFAAYLASDTFATSGKALRPLMTAPPSSRRYHAELLEEVA